MCEIIMPKRDVDISKLLPDFRRKTLRISRVNLQPDVFLNLEEIKKREHFIDADGAIRYLLKQCGEYKTLEEIEALRKKRMQN